MVRRLPERFLLDSIYWRDNSTVYGRISRFFPILPKIEGGKILDWGCSTGQTTKEIRDLYPNCRILGIDIEPRVINLARKEIQGVEFMVADGYFPLFRECDFSAVICSHNLFYAVTDSLHRGKILGLLPNIGRIICIGGYILISGSHSVIAQKRENEFFLVQSTVPEGDVEEKESFRLILENLVSVPVQLAR
jgi:SAM-dependent methyltransferase